METTGPSCGDGKCSPGETPKTCPEDCDVTVEDPLTCLAKSCGELLAVCQDNPECDKIIACMESCEEDSEEACLDVCVADGDTDAQSLFWQLYDCGKANSCFSEEPDSCGNGKCEPGENPDNCFQDCSDCLLYTSPSPRDRTRSRMPSSA